MHSHPKALRSRCQCNYRVRGASQGSSSSLERWGVGGHAGADSVPKPAGMVRSGQQADQSQASTSGGMSGGVAEILVSQASDRPFTTCQCGHRHANDDAHGPALTEVCFPLPRYGGETNFWSRGRRRGGGGLFQGGLKFARLERETEYACRQSWQSCCICVTFICGCDPVSAGRVQEGCALPS